MSLLLHPLKHRMEEEEEKGGDLANPRTGHSDPQSNPEDTLEGSL